MRPVMLSFWISLDGYSVDMGTELGQLMEDIEDPEQQEHVVAWLRGAGVHIMGRTTYQEMAEFWPKSEHPIAAPMNEIPKVVFSPTLDAPRGRNRGSPVATRRWRSPGWKQQPGGPVISTAAPGSSPGR